MKKIFLLLVLLAPVLAGAQIRIQQMRSTGQPAGRIIQTDGNDSFEFTDFKADTMYISADTLYLILGDSTTEVYLGDLTFSVETDPIYSAWDKDYNDLINTPNLGSYLTTETDPIYSAWDKDYGDLINTPTIPTNNNELTNGAGYITGYTETDPVFGAWNKNEGIYITENQITDLKNYLEYINNTENEIAVFNADGKAQGYPEFTYNQATGVAYSNIFKFTLLQATDGTVIAGSVSGKDYFHVENQLHLNPFTTLDIGSIGRTATGFYVNIGGTIKKLLVEGDALTGYTETDPIYSAWDKSTGINITAAQVSDFDTEVANNTTVAANTAKTSFPGFTSLFADYGFTDNSTNWNTAYGWGNWATGMPAATMTFTNKSGNISQWTNDAAYLTAVPANSVGYAEVAATLKQEITDNDGAFDWSAAGQINCSISGATTFSFSNISVNKNIKIKLVITSSATVTWNTTPLDIRGDAISGDGTYLINLEAWGTTESDIAVTVRKL